MIAKPRFASLNRAHPISKGIVGAWPMIEGSATIIRDVAGKRLDATVSSGTPSMTQTKYGRALDQDSTADTMTAPDFVNFTFLKDGGGDSKASLLAVFKVDSLAANGTLIAKDAFSGAREWSFWYLSTGAIRLSFYGGSSTNSIQRESATGAVVTNKWYVGIATYDGSATTGGIKTFLNGLRVDTTDVTGGSYTSTADTTREVGIGSFADGNIGIVGKLANAVIWYNRELTINEIRQLTVDPFLMYRKRQYGVIGKAPAAGFGGLLSTKRNRLVLGD